MTRKEVLELIAEVGAKAYKSTNCNIELGARDLLRESENAESPKTKKRWPVLMEGEFPGVTEHEAIACLDITRTYYVPGDDRCFHIEWREE